MHVIKVAVIGATGYTGQELIKILRRKKGVEVAAVTSESSAGTPLSSVHPAFTALPHVLEKADPAKIAPRADVVFMCLPHGEAMNSANAYLEKGLKVFDLSADFRLKDPVMYREWYKLDHACPELLKEAVYGLPELHREKIKNARLVAVPGCYPTSVILAMAPLLDMPGLNTDVLTVNSASGVSGAGRKLKDDYMFAELEGDFYAYGAPAHRHTAEMEQELSIATGGRSVKVAFIPHLLPVTRGIFTTVTAPADSSVSEEALTARLRAFYTGSRFTRVVDGFPKMKWAVNTNMAYIGAKVDKRAGVAIVTCAIDNLVKGAAGQAVQCFNIVYGMEESDGLE